MVDTTAPTLTALRFPAVIDVALGSQWVKFEASASDNGSGIKEAVIWVTRWGVPSLGPIELSWNDGEFEVSKYFYEFSGPGTYDIAQVDVRDNVGNVRVYSSPDLTRLGFKNSFEIFTPAYRPDNFDNLLYGSGPREVLNGYGGNDTIIAVGGAAIGGGGNDRITCLGNSDCFFFGDAGDDVLTSGRGDDLLSGGVGADSLNGGPGNDTLFGEAGDDVLVPDCFRLSTPEPDTGGIR